METMHDPQGSSTHDPQGSSVHQRLVDWAARRATSDFECCTLLLAALRARTHRLLGFATCVQYGAVVTGLTERQVRERLRVAKALESLPKVAKSFAAGRLSFSKVRELSRVVTNATEETWIAETEPLTTAAVQELCSGRTHGDMPESPAKPEARRHRLEFENVDAEAKALLAEARRVLTEVQGESLDDSQFLRALAQHVLADQNPERASYQVALSECPSCKSVRHRAGGQPVVVEPVVVERALCDAQHIGNVDASSPERATQTIPPAVRRQVLARHDYCCAVPGCRLAAFVDVHHTKARSEGGDHDPDRLIPLCSNHHDMTHRGRLIISGTFTTGFVFRRADGDPVRHAPVRSLHKAGVLGEAYEALRSMGFEHSDAQRMLDAVRHAMPDESMDLEAVLREALRASPVSAQHRSPPKVAERRARYRSTGQAQRAA